MPDDLQVIVYDKDFAYQGEVSELLSLTATRRHLALSTAEFTTASDLDIRDALAAPASHVVCRYKDTYHVGGWVEADAGSVLDVDPITYRVRGHWDLLRMILGWPVPAAALSAQSVAYWTMTGGPAPAESVVKAVAQANITRLGLSWVTVATDQGRGSDVDPSFRFHPLTDRLLPALNQSGIGLSLELVEGQGLVLDAYAQTTHTVPLDVASGVIVAGTWDRKMPTASRAVAGSQGEAEARTFFGPIIDTAREAVYGFCGEVFIDARDSDDEATVTDRMNAALAEAGPTVSVSLQLAETEDFSYPEVCKVGDVWPVELRSDVSTTDVVSEVEVRADVNDGVVATPRIGARTDDPNVLLAQAVGRLAVGVRDEKVR